MASAKTVPIEVKFTMWDPKVPYDYKSPTSPVVGAPVRLVLGELPGWNRSSAGHRFVTDSRGEARFTMDGFIESRIRWRNVGFTPFALPSRSDHLFIAVELEHEIPVDEAVPPKVFHWMLTMDLDRFADAQCSTVGFTHIYTPDAEGDFTNILPWSGDFWQVPELGGKIVGMNYKVVNFGLDPDDDDPNKRTLTLTLERRHRPKP